MQKRCEFTYFLISDFSQSEEKISHLSQVLSKIFI